MEKLPFGNTAYPYNITFEKILELADATGIGPFGCCEDILVECKGDLDAAKKILLSRKDNEDAELPFGEIAYPYGITSEMIINLDNETECGFFCCEDILEQCKGDYDKAKELLSIDASKQTIGIQDFVVKTNMFMCAHHNHHLEEITAIIYCIDKAGLVIEKQIMAGYCSECNVYYILDKDFLKLKESGSILCRVVDNSKDAIGKTGYYANLSKESILKQYGYSVNQIDDLNSQQRQTILEFLMATKILNKTEICSYLDWFINARKYNTTRFRSAISRWKEDRDFVEKYMLDSSKRILVRKITKGSMY